MMPFLSDSSEVVPYQLAFVLPATGRILGERRDAGYVLPSAQVPLAKRPAAEIQRSIRETWQVTGIILDIVPSPATSPSLVIVELFCSEVRGDLVAINVEDVDVSEWSDAQRRTLKDILDGKPTESPFTRLGWIDEAVEWVESATCKRISSKQEIEQLNAGGHFSLIRFHMKDGSEYWLKATGAPNAHEPTLTVYLERLCGGYIPEVISLKSEWNAWLAVGEAHSITVLPADNLQLLLLLKGAVESLAKLQMRTAGHRLDLLQAGAFDQGLNVIQGASEPLFDYLEEAMTSQTSTKVAPIDRRRLQELRLIFDDVCHRMEDLDIPETIVHGDLNVGNLLVGCDRFQFIDWCEGYVGNPLVSLEHLLLLNKVDDNRTRQLFNCSLRRSYRDVWMGKCDLRSIDEGMMYAPFLAIGSALYRRGDWLESPEKNSPSLQSRARALARHLDRAAQGVLSREGAC